MQVFEGFIKVSDFVSVEMGASVLADA